MRNGRQDRHDECAGRIPAGASRYAWPEDVISVLWADLGAEAYRNVRVIRCGISEHGSSHADLYKKHRKLSAIEDLLKALKQARATKGMSQREVSERTGVPQSHLSKIESGLNDTRLSSLIELARALDLEVALRPRKAVSAVETVVRSIHNPAPVPSFADIARRSRELEQALKL